MMQSLGNAYQLAAFGQEDQALAMLNRGLPPNQMADSLVVDDNGDFLIGRRGKVDRIPLAQIRRFIPKDPMDTTSAMTRKVNDAKARAFIEFSKEYDVSLLTSTQQKQIAEALAAGADPADLVAAYNLTKSSAAQVRDDAQAQVAALTAEIDAISAKQEAGDYRTAWGRKRDAAKRTRLMAERMALMSRHGIQTSEAEAEDQAEPRGTGVIRTDKGEMTVEDLRSEKPRSELIQLYPEYDSNDDGQIDTLDQDYADAKRAVTIAQSSPEARKKIIEYLDEQTNGAGARMFLEFEALVQAVEKQARTAAEERVSGASDRVPGNIPGTGPFSLSVL